MLVKTTGHEKNRLTLVLSCMADGTKLKPMPEVCQWVINSWSNLKVETIVKAFKKCGISNALDMTEDDYLWDDMDEEAADDVQHQPMESDDDLDLYDDIHADD